ncbi:TCR/Tet family MFS transporter [Runella salmonicolor]|uniref:TCR/Tet family MFS transporter n=1 Tax=Runella salmonicolor TaxID=2950278 RepID=A0ABT1FR62_9BACT|nr:TCR/Tet family MFS transporter [Runella salmonicolor]MCP1384256.1 TCR/Tet family MFS transporter [Runella salmonicolor]
MAEKRNSALIFIFITLLIDITGIGIIVPVIPRLIQELTSEGLSDAALYGGWLMFVYSVAQFIFSPILGGLSDQYGRRPILLGSLFGFGLDYIFSAFASSIGWLFLARVIAGIFGASFSTAGAYIADVSPPEKRAQNFGLIGAAFGLGFILGPMIGGLLGQYGPRVPFFVSAGLSLLNCIYGYFVLPESLDEKNRRPFDWKRANPVGALRHLQKYPVIFGLVIPLVLTYIAGYATQSTWTYFTMEKFGWDEKWVGYSLAFVGLMAAIVQGGLTRTVIPRLGNTKSIYWGLSLYALSFLLYAFADKGWMMFAITVMSALGGIATPALQAIMSNEVPPNEQGELRGALTGLMSLTAIFGPIMMTSLFAYFTSSSAPFQFAGAPFMMGAVLTVFSLVLVKKLLTKN